MIFTPLAIQNPPFIKINSPNGNEILYIDSTISIDWKSEGIQGNVVILLFYKGLKDITISENAPNSGQYLWKIPATVLPGKFYRIRIRSLADLSINDFSDADFTIQKQQ